MAQLSWLLKAQVYSGGFWWPKNGGRGQAGHLHDSQSAGPSFFTIGLCDLNSNHFPAQNLLPLVFISRRSKIGKQAATILAGALDFRV